MDEMQLQLIAQQLRKPEGDDGLKTGEMMNQGNRLINQLTLEKLAVSEGDAILELGMGNGFFVKDIVSVHPSVQYTGCDYSQTMIAAAEDMNRERIEKGQATFRHATADKLPFADSSFNKVMGVNIIYFWPDPSVELAEIKRVLHPGGKLIIGIRPKHAMISMPFTKYGFTMYSKEELVDLLEANSFSVTDVLEQQEPAFEMGGNTIRPESLVVTAVKN